MSSPVDVIVGRLNQIELKIDTLMVQLDVSGHQLRSTLSPGEDCARAWVEEMAKTPPSEEVRELTAEPERGRTHVASLVHAAARPEIPEGAFSPLYFDPALAHSPRIAEAVAKVDPGAIEVRDDGMRHYMIPLEFVALYEIAGQLKINDAESFTRLIPHLTACERVMTAYRASLTLPPTTAAPLPLPRGRTLAAVIALAGDRGTIRRAGWHENRNTSWAEIQNHWRTWFEIADYAATDWEVVP